MNYQEILDNRGGDKITVSEFYERVEARGVSRIGRNSSEPLLRFDVPFALDGKPLDVPEWFFKDVEEFFAKMCLKRLIPQDALLPDFSEFDGINILDVFTGYERFMKDIRSVHNKVTWAGFVEGYRQALLDYKEKCPHCSCQLEEAGHETD